ncbi:DUF2062 domain-containing protein [Sulfurisoma sediminicola]|uniref:DUF2062 domain-containing protein n=1 Tax=Sulfurisoma sediminicola TaxID=1381557 RepID=A0A497XEA7_9PROT|nr:DUF2062 domain-containing protein [Sulfurisoma sediminicola]RLJ65311.1 hypothetical protein DFR35_1971 [Sulfurisoma sediminicola]
MRKHLRKYLPDHTAVHDNKWLAPFADTLLHPRLWHLNRHSAAGAVAVGLFCGLIPGPFQMLGAAICALVFRVNLPLALFTTLYTNPLTIVPLYVVAFELGKWVLPGEGEVFVAPPDYAGSLFGWVEALVSWMLQLGKPLAVGLVLLAALLSVAGYLAMRLAYRIYLVRAWRHRTQRRPE